MSRRLVRALVIVVVLLAAAAAGAGVWARSRLRGSLPQLDGQHILHGLDGPVEVTRDGLGIPTIRAANRRDLARATGFVHGQDRFFQMDLSRRRAAGELAALVGPAALQTDLAIRIHRFRAEAERALTSLSRPERELIEAYSAGVNDALQATSDSPFEYLLLRQTPEPWRPEDSLLVVLSMFVTLQDSDGTYESTLGTMHEVLPPAAFEFFAPRGTEWDAPIVGSAFALPPIPDRETYDLRTRRWGRVTRTPALDDLMSTDASSATGSNNFAVSGALTTTGSALLANDMHLGIRVPNTWYRAALEWPDPSDRSEPRRLIGVTLPGVPALVVGSNTYVAWGFTNTNADFSDVVLLDTDMNDPRRYRTPDGWKTMESFDEVVHVAGDVDVHLPVEWTVWGPVIAADFRGRARAFRWVAHDAARLASSITPLEDARTIEEAIAVANGLGTPAQNFLVADRSGRIAWSIYGSIPRRRGFDGLLPSSWADGSHTWAGWLDDAEYPRVIDPSDGRLWTANARVVDGDMLSTLGDGNYEIGSRARIIRERLRGRSRFEPRDLLNIQLDVGADFMERWRDVILRTLTREAIADHPGRAEFRRIVEDEWSGLASPDATAYRLTRAFRDAVSERVIRFALSECYEADPGFDYTRVRRRDGPIWALAVRQPLHLLDPRYESWTGLLVEAVDATIDDLTVGGARALSERVWSEFNRPSYRHPLSAAIPALGRWLDMPPVAIPGDLYTPRVSWRANGASERMIVSPGREEEGIMEMPTGQSGHPLSPFYGNSHEAWVRGEATPFLPGPAVHTLTLVP